MTVADSMIRSETRCGAHKSCGSYEDGSWVGSVVGRAQAVRLAYDGFSERTGRLDGSPGQ